MSDEHSLKIIPSANPSALTEDEWREVERIKAEHAHPNSWGGALIVRHKDRGTLLRIIDRLTATPATPPTGAEPAEAEVIRHQRDAVGYRQAAQAFKTERDAARERLRRAAELPSKWEIEAGMCGPGLASAASMKAATLTVCAKALRSALGPALPVRYEGETCPVCGPEPPAPCTAHCCYRRVVETTPTPEMMQSGR